MVCFWRVSYSDRIYGIYSMVYGIPTPPNVPLLSALGFLLDGIWGPLKGSLGVLVVG